MKRNTPTVILLSLTVVMNLPFKTVAQDNQASHTLEIVLPQVNEVEAFSSLKSSVRQSNDSISEAKINEACRFTFIEPNEFSSFKQINIAMRRSSFQKIKVDNEGQKVNVETIQVVGNVSNGVIKSQKLSGALNKILKFNAKQKPEHLVVYYTISN